MEKDISKQPANQLIQDAKLGLEEILRQGARKMLQATIEVEVAEYIEKNRHALDEEGHCLVVRNGSSPERNIITGIGKVRVRQPLDS